MGPDVVHLDPDLLQRLEAERAGSSLEEVVNALLRESLEKHEGPVETLAEGSSAARERDLPFWLEKDHASHGEAPDDELRKRVSERRMTETDGRE